MSNRRVQDVLSPSRETRSGSLAPSPELSEAQALLDAGHVSAAAALAANLLSQRQNPAEVSRLKLIEAVSEFEMGSATESIDALKRAAHLVAGQDDELELAVNLALFSRESQFLTPAEVIPTLGKVRQLAASLGSPQALAGLHLAVARVEAYRGHCVDARRHLEIARKAAAVTGRPMLAAAINLVDAALEQIAGNLERATRSAKDGFEQSSLHGFGILRAGSITNLGHMALVRLDLNRALDYLERGVDETADLSFVRLAALDSLLQLALCKDDLDRCELLSRQCSELIAQQVVPSRSWYDLAHQVSRCSVLSSIGDWPAVLEITDGIDEILEARQFRSLQALLLCASAKAWAHMEEPAKSRSRLAAAVRVCPRGAIDPLIVLEATSGVCLTLSGERTRGDQHFDRALSAARAIGNRLQEHQILQARKACQPPKEKNTTADASFKQGATNGNERSLVLADVATILGASSSIDLIAHRAMSLIQGTSLENRLNIQSVSDQEFRPEISIESNMTAAGKFEIRLRGSDRLVSMAFDRIDSLDDVTIVNSLLELLNAAVHQDSRRWNAAGEQDLWPETVGAIDDETVFASSRMAEILRVAIRLAATDLPILVTGETGTGKDVFARLIHAHSAVKRGPFIPFNCSAVPRDLIESQLFGHRRGAFTGAVDAQPGVIRSASGGTLFLDEIGDLDLTLQPKLLRFIETGEIHTLGDPRPNRVGVRLIAATNVDLDGQAQTGLFRKDLLFRLGGTRITLPPLRERKDEIPALTTSFVNRFSREISRPRLRVSDDLIAALLLYDWPGNIRQLANELHRIVALAEPGQTLTSADLSPVITEGWTVAPKAKPDASDHLRVNLDQPLPQAVEEIERAFIGRAMQASGGRVAEAAQLLGISRKGLFLKRRRWGYLDRDEDQADG
jgi:DNA-binding NtrC family response regulator